MTIQATTISLSGSIQKNYSDYFEMLSDIARFAKENAQNVSTLPFDGLEHASLAFCTVKHFPFIIWRISANDIEKSLKQSKFLGLLDYDISSYKTLEGRMRLKQIINSGLFPVR